MPTLLFHTSEDRLGDALIKLPVIMALKSQRPDVRLIWSTGDKPSAFKRGLAPLVEQLIDEVHEITGLGSSWSQAFRSHWSQHFDCIIVSERKLRATLALRRIPHTLFIAPMHNFMLSDRKPAANLSRAPAYRQIQALFELAIGQALTLPQELVLPTRYLELAERLLPPGPRYIGFAPGAGGKAKCWPLKYYIEVARVQVLKRRVPVFFLGPDEKTWRDELALAVPAAIFPEYSVSGQLLDGPPLTIALSQRLGASVANDSGTGHLLAAGGRPLVSLFGRTDSRKFEPPFGTRKVILASDFGDSSISSIPLDHVLQALEDACC